ncbi:MAG: protein kinase domain-containing protein [Planctomycetota bacterium]|jgi:hypothetical protein
MKSGRQRSPRDYYYGEVLQLPPGTKQPDHYVLLGVRYFEEDHDTILRAALERIRLLEACEADPRPAYRKALAQLIAEVREAQMALLDPRRRRAYDAALTGTTEVEPGEDSREIELPPGTMYADRYRILREIRRGALGVVYEAGDKNLRSKVHVSILRPRLSHERIPHRRIEQAARTAHALDHPGILRLDEVGTGDGLLFVRTRAVERRGVLELIEATETMRLETDKARLILMGIADALKYAHAQGIVHGDLQPRNVFVDDEGHALVVDFCLSRAVADALDDKSSLYREPENDLGPAADLFALGCIGYQMLTGMPPFPADAAGETPKPLPDDVPVALGELVMGLLVRDPAQRPSLEDVITELRRERRSKRLPLYIAAGVLVVAGAVAGGVALLGGFGGAAEEKPPVTIEAEAWRLVANRKFDAAIARLRPAREADPADASLSAPLAQALEGAAEEREKAGDPWRAQVLLKEAAQLEPSPRRAEALERVTAVAVARLLAIRVEIAEVTNDPVISVVVHRLRSCVIGGNEFVPGAYVAGPTRMRLPSLTEGRHELPFVMIDRAGNRRAGSVVCIVDRTAPALAILEPPEGAQFRKGRVPFRVRVEDANPGETVSVNGQAAPLKDGEALGVLEFEDGEHTIEVVARDRAGNEAETSRKIVVDSKAPELELATARIATRDGLVSVRGRVHSRAEQVTVDGQPVAVDADGAFAADVVVKEDRAIPVVAVGVTGLRRELPVEVLLDDRPPRVGVLWERRDQRGTLLYGTKEMDAGTLALPLRADDKTRVTLLPEQGRVEGNVWHVPARQGRATVRLRARDEAGNETELRVDMEGHRATPRLTVKCSTDEITNDKETQLDIEADRAVLVQGEPREPGRLKMPLPEGKVELVVQAIDPYGNETRWTSRFTVDRTPPKIELEGGPERGIGRQELFFVADEELRSLTCFGKTVRASGRSAGVETTLGQGRRRVHVIAKDLAGNSTKATFNLDVKNRVLVLDGRGAAVQVALPATVNLDTFTVECWVRGLTPLASSTVLSNYDRAGFGLKWGSSKVHVPYAELCVDKSGRVPLPARKGWKWENWVHLALSHDGKRVRFYVNGSLQQSAELKERLVPSKAPLYIGRSPGRHADFFRGAIDEVRISNVARYTRGFSPPRFHKEDDKTVLLLRFDMLRGKLFPDSSDHGHHGIPLGNPRLHEESR